MKHLILTGLPEGLAIARVAIRYSGTSPAHLEDNCIVRDLASIRHSYDITWKNKRKHPDTITTSRGPGLQNPLCFDGEDSLGNAKAVGLLCLVAVSGLGFAGEAAHAQTVVPFTLEAGHLVVVEGWIGRAGNLKLVIDTGASVTVISRRVAKALGLKGPAKRTAAFDKQVEVAEVRIPAVVIGELRIEQAPARIGPLEYTDLAEPVEIDALIGLDLLRVAAKTGLMIDYGSQTLTFGPVTHRAATKPFYKKLPLIPVSLSVRGKTLNLLLDTGYGELVLFGRAVEGRIAFRRTGETADIRTAGGKKRIEKVLLPEVRLAEQQWESFPAYVLDAAAPISRLDGVLGVRSLGLKRLCLDFDRGLMSWER